jgi:hypothetical protein
MSYELTFCALFRRNSFFRGLNSFLHLLKYWCKIVTEPTTAIFSCHMRYIMDELIFISVIMSERRFLLIYLHRFARKPLLAQASNYFEFLCLNDRQYRKYNLALPPPPDIPDNESANLAVNNSGIRLIHRLKPRTSQITTHPPWGIFIKLRGLSPRENYTDSRLSTKLMPIFADRGCHVVSVTDPYGRILGFLDRMRDI